MRFTQNEKYEIIRLVEDSELGVNRTLGELGIPKRTFYNWYGKYTKHGYDGLAPKDVPQTASGIEYLTKSEMKWLSLL